MSDSDALSQPHDWLFKNTLRVAEHAASVFKSVLPERLVALVDWSTLQLDASETAALAVGPSDLRFQVVVQGIEARLFVVYEHQSSTDKHMVFRLLRYMVGLWSDLYAADPTKLLPPILPIVLHHSDSGWTVSVDLLDEIELTAELRELLLPHLPSFRFVLDDISKRTDEEFRAQALAALPLATLLAFVRLRGATRVSSFSGYLEETLLTVLKAPSGLAALNRILRYAVQASKIDLEELRPYILHTFGTYAEETVMTTGERLRQEGIEKGLQQGIEKGLQQGIEKGRQRARDLVRKQLTLKFGALPDVVIERINAASETELDRYAEELLSASALEQIFGGGA